MQSVYIVAIEGIQCAILTEETEAQKLKNIFLSIDKTIKIDIFEEPVWNNVEQVVSYIEYKYNKDQGVIN